MKIAIICEVLSASVNGTAVATHNLAEHLRASGHEVVIVCAEQSKSGEDGYFVLPQRRFGKALDSVVRKSGASLAKCSKKLMNEALKGVDYIHCMMPFSLGAYAADYAKAHGVPISAGFHFQAEQITAYFKCSKIKFIQKLVYRCAYKRLFSKVDAIHYPTQFIRSVFETSIKRPTNGYVISNGVNRAFKPQKTVKPKEFADKFVITSIGRYSKEKAQDVLINAIKLSPLRDNIQLILAGSGIRQKYYKRLSRNLPNPPIFRTFTRTEMADVLGYTDIYVHPAAVELEGIACLEAIKCGKLTIVSDSELSATKSFAKDKCCIFHRNSALELSLLINYWLNNPNAKRKCEEKYLESEIPYVDECMKKMDAMIDEVIKKKVQSCN